MAASVVFFSATGKESELGADPPTFATPDGRSDVSEGMRRAEAIRARAFARVAVILSALGLGFLWINPVAGCLQTATVIAMVALIGSASMVWFRATPERGYPRALFRVFGITALIESFLIELHQGLFSPFTAVVVLGISFFGLGEERRAVLGYCSVAILAYLVPALLVAFDVIDDPGIFSSDGVPFANRIFVAFMMAAVYVVALVQARLTRRAMADAMERATAAARDAMRRQAQLEEAQAHLDRVLKAGAGRKGRFSGTKAGAYMLAELVGRGATGEIYAARDLRSGARVAVKLLPEGPGCGPNTKERFAREAQVAAGLRAPNLVEVYELGQAEDGTPYIAMELLTGHDLAWHLRQRTRMTLDEAARLVEQIAAGISVAHAVGVVHRDLKPQNVFLSETRGGSAWKVLDFGICALQESSLTQEGDFVGTPGYIAPEQALGKRTDERADVFSLGALAYRVITGQPPFPGPAAESLYRGVHESPIQPSELLTTLSRDVDAVLALALAKNPDDRFASVLDFAASLRAAADGRLALGVRVSAKRMLRGTPWSRVEATPAVLPLGARGTAR